MIEFANLLEKLRDPQFLHHLLEPLLIYGLALGIMGFLVAFAVKERKMQLAALILIIGSALTIVPYTHFRKKADAEQMGELLGAEKAMVEEHHTRLLEGQWIYFGIAGLAALTLLMGAHKGTAGHVIGGATATAGAGAVIFRMWLHLKSEYIEHPELRVANSKPAKPQSESIVTPIQQTGADLRKVVYRRIQ